ncbi:MAG TPA: ABC transporter ATP-binding protein [Terriglobales bacterium]|nr:ABC transporter ATP-binding protein [Terriglobales bacterium]
MKPIIQVEGVSKQYQIGAREVPYQTLRESLMQMFRPRRHAPTESIWALRDLCFNALPGDVIGVIGRNGAGKSTLLKILSRITEPTTGRIDLYGRVGSLLEVGTGFHQELTGRENIFLNGAILGMKRAEIVRKFDDIVAFAEVDKFIDTPVKRYSSGMYLRLAFAVAAFLESEILLVDEVLAVGDASFQKKCLGKMRDVSASGRTVLFVSHNMAAIEGLCSRCLFISEGKLIGDGPPHEIVTRYLAAEAVPENAARELIKHPGRRGGMKPYLRNVSIQSQNGLPASAIRMGEGLSLFVEFHFLFQRHKPNLSVTVKNNYGVPVFTASTHVQKQYQVSEQFGAGTVVCHLRDLPLLAGTYSVDLFLAEEYHLLDAVYDAISFEVIPVDVFGSGEVPQANDGTIFWPAEFEFHGLKGAKADAR